MDKKSKLLLALLIIATIISVGFTVEETLVKENLPFEEGEVETEMELEIEVEEGNEVEESVEESGTASTSIELL